MGVPRSNSPSTVSHRAVTEAKKGHVKRAPSKQLQLEQLPQVNQMEDSNSTYFLKSELKALLAASKGCPKEETITDIIAKLSERDPCPKGFAKLDCFPGDFAALSIPNFPGRIKPAKKNEEDIAKYTLGRLSFNIFQPNELVCTVRSIQNQMHRISSDDDAAVFSYNFVCDLIIHTPEGDLEATLINKAFCRENENRDNRMSVTFTGGCLIPGNENTSYDPNMLGLWEKTFAKAYERATKERTLMGWIYHYCLVLFLGLTMPKDATQWASSRNEHSFHFDIKRPPKGFFDVLYLDDDVRITKGNRGTITVVERLSPNGFSQ